ncbi:hypothetical protein Ahy_A06g029576 [Arachis hypogaea]|uniref:Uncharacterized protein n=1 Tax=Arachis hypogaea TaxID=3818 RepID=A0A445CTT0_ARAHY|nr:hypothetical protein Ahy_A06g029576 [Arachis hypogaea]
MGDSLYSCTLYGTLSTILPSGRYTTIEWVSGYSRCWRMFVRGRTPNDLVLAVNKEGTVSSLGIDAGFKHQRLINKANMASARSSKNTSSLATFMKTNVRLSKSLDHETTLVETFKYTHTLKENKARFFYQRSQDHYEFYTQRLEAMTQQSQQSMKDTANSSAASVINPDAIWREAASAPYKNHVYELGSFFANLQYSKGLPLVEPSRLRMELNDYGERYQEILTCVTDTDNLKLEWREQLEWLQWMEAQMEMRTADIIPAGGTQTSPPSAPPLQGHRTDDDDDYLDI